jgi:hypothetical protein
VFTDLVASVPGTTTLISNLTVGETYSFAIEARNVFGFGPISSTYTIVAVSIPSKMSPVIVSQVGTNVIFTLTAPNSNGATITAYSVYIMNGSSGAFVNATSSCQESASSILSTGICTVPMSTV